MDLSDLARNWDQFSRLDPMWAILTDPQKTGHTWQPEEFFATGAQEIAQVIETSRSLEYDPHGSALDFGCGIGRLTFALGQYFSQCAGVDISPTMIALAQEHSPDPEKYHFYLNQSEDLRIFEDNSFDFIYSNLVLQHMKPDYVFGYVREFQRLIKNDGLIVFRMPSKQKLTSLELSPSAITAGLKRILPLPRPASTEPMMEMHAIPISSMKTFIQKQGCTILKTDEKLDNYAGWYQVTYFVRKAS